MKNTLLFDLDGTLLDTLKDLTISVNYMLKHYDRPLKDEKEIRSFLGNGAFKLIELAVGEPLNEEALKERFNFYDAHYQTHSLDNTKPYPDILKLLDIFKSKGYKMAVISNKQDAIVKDLVQKIFPDTFLAAVGVGKDGVKKPDPRMIEKVLKEIKATKEEAYLIGDSEVDIQTGQNADVEVIACLWGFRDMKDIAPLKPNFIVGKPMDIIKVI
ncbi:MAG: HAD-IIIA family hydrolase [Acholeplasma sp.]|nr:HAD-IIIA family hydrolase [Acholeplasma sp.]